ncbi:hypothetical protein RBSWK_01432 [Rhodopirellula baltica SWK14]|uniref:Uncharacterized protein n=1 Tax=Rhodopirellula baltica SWK14 TaxID=993516 RepID=L7CLB4_RHOBT|nr:hypothetical protein RBSWK_01432 [Rhodopirellula baltica SWK14]
MKSNAVTRSNSDSHLLTWRCSRELLTQLVFTRIANRIDKLGGQTT